MSDKQEDAFVAEVGKLRARVYEQEKFLRELEEEMLQYSDYPGIKYWISKIGTFLNIQQWEFKTSKFTSNRWDLPTSLRSCVYNSLDKDYWTLDKEEQQSKEVENLKQVISRLLEKLYEKSLLSLEEVGSVIEEGCYIEEWEE